MPDNPPTNATVANPDEPSRPIQRLWLRFVEAIRPFLDPRADDRPLDQFLPLREKVLELVRSHTTLQNLDYVFSSNYAPPLGDEIADILREELVAWVHAAEVATKAAATPMESKTAKTLLGRASTIVGSFRDAANKHPHLSLVMGAFKELLDIFKA